MPSSVPAVKTGLRVYLASWEGLRPGDKVTVRSAPGVELGDDIIELGDVTTTQGRAGLAGKTEDATMTCWCQATRPGTSEESSVVPARARAYALLAAVEEALAADPTAGGVVPPPQGTLTVGGASLVEAPADLTGGGGRRAQVRFTISWTSHIT
jgi:hypothetical protein